MLRRYANHPKSPMDGGPRSPRRFGSPFLRQGFSPSPAVDNAFDLIRQEIAIMKKLDHPNVVQLIEVLDDPSEDLLYMILEMCKKGVVMHVGLEEGADPYDNERCRVWFRDMILGIEYRKNVRRTTCSAILMQSSSCARHRTPGHQTRQLSYY
jgi:calcium/calmodulin-dependent protein kinase kinase 2